MIQDTHSNLLHHRSSLWRWIVSIITVLVMSIGSFTPLAQVSKAYAEPAAVPTNHMMLSVMDASSSSVITEYKYLINIDNTGNPLQPRDAGCSPEDAGYPDSCDWPSIRAVPGAAPIYTQGNQDDFNGATLNGLDLPDGKYLVSVMANGYKMGGFHFTMPMEGDVTVRLQPHPMPAATMRIKVFEDNASVNGQIDTDEPGLEGFHVVINDILGQVSTDVFGNPLCTTYDAGGNSTGINLYGCTTSDANGDLAIPNLGPNRYDVVVVPPSGTDWTETTTLEGSPSWDTWLQEGGTGLDNEFVIAGEPFPWTMFGFVKPMDALNSGATGGISGTLVSASVYLPQQGALPYFGDIWSGFTGTKVTGPITDGWVALSDLQNGDQAVYVGRANSDGTFAISNVPDGNYLFTWWDTNLHYIMDWIQVTVSNGQMTDIGTPMLTGWFTKVDGYVFNDLNSNGRRDGGEPGVSDYLVVLKDRDNSEIDRMSISATTDANGYYVFEKAYPMGSWMILEAYSDRYYTTGVTYQVENQPDETTVLGAGVDVGLLPILGQSGRLDWGVRPYDRGANGGIVGTVFYDITRNELDPQYQAVEGWAPGIPNVLVTLSKPVWCGTTDAPCDPTETYELAPDGSYAKDMTAGGVACGTDPSASCDPTGTWELDESGNYAVGPIVSTAITETWEQPSGCIARDPHGDALAYPSDQALISDYNARCLEAPLSGTQFQTGFASLDGNYGFDTVYSGFGTATEPVGESIPADDYLVEVVMPNDDLGRPTYQVVREEDINIFGGDEFIPAVPPPACAGPLHTVDVAGVGADGPNAVDNPSFADAGGSVFEGMDKPLCNVKLVTLNNGKSVAPAFTYFTDVPIPGRWKGYIIDDLTVSTNPMDLNYGEKAGVPYSPIGIYDFTNNRVASMVSDPNGVFEILLPSTYSINCPTPSGVCPNVYYMLGNDPNLPGYNPQYRTIGASFEIYPGLLIPSDLAPTQIVPGVLAGGSLFGAPPQCGLDPATPQIFTVSKPYVSGPASGAGRIINVQGLGFGTTPGLVTLDGSPAGLTVSNWSDTQFTLNVSPSVQSGPHQLAIRAGNGKSTINGLTIHAMGGNYSPQLFEVGPGKTYATIQAAVNAAAAAGGQGPKLVVVYPSSNGMYLENVIISSKMKLQGVGPGGEYPNGTKVVGSVIDGRGVTGDTPYAEAWNVFITGLNWSGNQSISEGPVVYVVAQDGNFNNNNPASIDGFVIQGGDQQGFPNQVVASADPTVKEITGVQGGGIYVNGYARYLQITNNVLQSNGGSYGGAIRLGTPHLPGAFNDSQNDFVRIANNRILANGSSNLAGAVAIYSGAEGYEVTGNDICGNFSAEYGGGISHYGLSPNGSIHHNRIYFNRSYDEGGGVMIAGELPADPDLLTPGAGPVNIYANLIQNNLANDDGGGLRFLMAGNFQYNVYNNMIVNNISTHEGGGVSLNDAPNVRFFNNTVMKNITTATAMTSNGQPAPAGLATSRNSNLLQASLPGSSPLFSDPLLFNNIFWDNRAGTFVGSTVAGIGLTGDPNPINYWDLGVSEGIGSLSPTNSVMQVTTGTNADPTNIVGADPNVISTYDTTVRALPWRGNPRFVDILMITTDATPNLLGDYHINIGSPAFNMGAAAKSGVNAPADDFDRNARPARGGYDIGADEIPPTADLSITKTDNQTNVTPGTQIRYTITVSNAGPDAVTSATVTDLFPTPSPLSGTINWTCTVTGGATCGGTTTGSGNINRSVNIPVGSTVTFTTTSGSVATTATGWLTNTASVSAAGILDPNLSNNSATDTDAILTTSNLAVTKTDNITSISAKGIVTYSIVVSNSGPQAVTGATVTDTLSAGYSSFNWVCSATGGSSCTIGAGSGTTYNSTVNLASGGSATFTATAVIAATASGSVTNTVVVTPPVNTIDPNPANNTAVDTDTIISAPALPALSSIDNFNRANANTLGANWSQVVLFGSASIRVNTNQAYAALGGWAMWNNPSAGYGNRQGAAFTFSNTPIGGTLLNPSLMLKGSGGSSTTPANYIRVTYDPSTGRVAVTTFNGGTINRAAFTATFSTNDTLSATAIANGTVYLYKNGVAMGAVTVPTSGPNAWTYGTGGGRIGLILPTGQRVDNFSGGTIP